MNYNDEAIMRRVIGEYAEMPGLRLTPEQAARLWGLEREMCHTILDTLVEHGVLYQLNGRYQSAGNDLLRRARAARVTESPVRTRTDAA